MRGSLRCIPLGLNEKWIQGTLQGCPECIGIGWEGKNGKMRCIGRMKT